MYSFSLPKPDSKRVTKWYFGGIAATFSQIIVYPIDVLKVGIETEQIMERISSYRYFKYLLATQGLTGIYSGLGYSMRQQFIHSTTRFGIYLKIKEIMQMRELPLLLDMGLSAFSGACGAILKNPIEMVNIRMQADFKLSPAKRHNYKSLKHGLKLITLTDGYRALFVGVQLTIARSVAFNTSQVCFYYQLKRYLQEKYRLTDTLDTHILASAITGFIATVVCQPIDVVKLRYISKTDEFASIRQVLAKQMQMGIRGFYRGTMLTFLKTEIQTITTFVLMEKMRLHYGLEPEVCADEQASIWCASPEKPVGEILEQEVKEGVERLEERFKEAQEQEAVGRLMDRLSRLKGLFWRIADELSRIVTGEVEEEVEAIVEEQEPEEDKEDEIEVEEKTKKSIYDFSI